MEILTIIYFIVYHKNTGTAIDKLKIDKLFLKLLKLNTGITYPQKKVM